MSDDRYNELKKIAPSRGAYARGYLDGLEAAKNFLPPKNNSGSIVADGYSRGFSDGYSGLLPTVRAGRPAFVNKQVRSTRLPIRTTESLKARVSACAKASGLSVSGWVERAVEYKIQQESEI